MEGRESKVTVYLKGRKINLDKKTKNRNQYACVVCIAALLCSGRLFLEVSGACLPSEAHFRTREEVGVENDSISACPDQGEWVPYTTGGDQPVTTQNLNLQPLCDCNHSGHILWRKNSGISNPMSYDGCGLVVISPESTFH